MQGPKRHLQSLAQCRNNLYLKRLCLEVRFLFPTGDTLQNVKRKTQEKCDFRQTRKARKCQEKVS